MSKGTQHHAFRIPEDAIEAAANTQWLSSDLYAQCGGDLKDYPEYKKAHERNVRRILEAAAPHIRSAALTEAADHLDKPRAIVYDHLIGAAVMQKEGDYSSIIALTEWIRMRASGE